MKQSGNRSTGPKAWAAVMLTLLLLSVCACQNQPQRVKAAQPAVHLRLNAPQWIEISKSISGSKDYYVSTAGKDTNDGSKKRPWRTIQRASIGLQPGAIVHVAPGEYVANDRIKTAASGTPEQRIRYVSDEKWGARLVSNEAGKWGMVWQNSGDYVDIDGFDVTGTGAWGIVNGGSHVRVMNNRAHDIPAEGCPGSGGAGIAHSSYKSVDNDTIANEVHDIGNPNTQCWTVHGIYHMNPKGRIMNNLVYRNWGWGIHTYHAATDLIISNNTLFANTYGGIVVSAAAEDFPEGTGQHSNTLVSNNIVYRNGLIEGAKGYGIEEFGSAVGPGNVYTNNLVFENGPENWKLKNKEAFNNIEADPQFVKYTGDSRGDYRLARISPAVGAGTSYGAPTVDIAGQSRKNSAAPDLGAHQVTSK